MKRCTKFWKQSLKNFWRFQILGDPWGPRYTLCLSIFYYRKSTPVFERNFVPKFKSNRPKDLSFLKKKKKIKYSCIQIKHCANILNNRSKCFFVFRFLGPPGGQRATLLKKCKTLQLKNTLSEHSCARIQCCVKRKAIGEEFSET